MQAKDFQPTVAKPAGSGSRARKGRDMPPLLMGIIIGLLLGIMLALGVATWLNRANNPFLEKSRPVEALPAFAPKAGVAPVAKSDAEKPRFEFYQILPGDKSGAERSVRHDDAPFPVLTPSDATLTVESLPATMS